MANTQRILVLVLTLLAAVSSSAQSGLAGTWTGVDQNNHAVTLELTVKGDEAFRLARDAMKRIGDAHDAAPRIDLCAAAFLQNRDADEGGAL